MKFWAVQRSVVAWTVLIIVIGGVFLWQRFTALPHAVAIQSHIFTLEIAVTEEERARGLSGRSSLCESCGMLFLFPHEGHYSFWMQGMQLPLDILWLSGERVVHIERNVAADAQDIFTPTEKADRVVEINAGKAQDIEVGEKVQWLYK